ncbi:hypothetical protein GCM10023088_74140 [Actinomadura verrucosospora]|uniref:hypothetical protein n=1 Tax=Actinomadura verrucosospora TaxID=46165 RepID=UPI0031EB3FDD
MKPLYPLVAAALIGTGVAVTFGERPDPPRLFATGIAVGRDGQAIAIPPGTRGRYIPHTSFFVPDDPHLRSAYAVPAPEEAEQSLGWLKTGYVPASSTPYGEMVERALLDLRLLTGDDGAMVAALHPRWRYVWPRDASFAVAALSVTRHHPEARRILDFLQRIHPARGFWQARYLPDRSGRAPDDRGEQIDGSGWVPWAVWVWFTTNADRRNAAQTLQELWSTVATSADAAAHSLEKEGLPAASPDYWEKRERRTTLGTAAPLLLGLRAATDLARRTGRHAEAAQWSDAARRLDGAITNTFGRSGYPRTVPDGGADTAVTFLAPPFAPSDPAVDHSVAEAAGRLTLANGGMKPGSAWKRDGIAWTAETAFFALAEAASGRSQARSRLAWLAAHRTPLGALPEKVDPAGKPVSVAPLSWTAAMVVLTAATLESSPALAPPTQ